MSGHLLPRVGAGCRSDDPETFSQLASLAASGVLDHLQVVVIPEDRDLFATRCDFMARFRVPLIIHAPYHAHGVNPAEPSCCVPSPLGSPEAVTRLAMEETWEIADRTGSPWVVFHPGAVRSEDHATALRNVASFLDEWDDDRIILENLPARSHGWTFLGSTAQGLTGLTQEGGYGTCLDFAHLCCTSAYLRMPFSGLLEDFDPNMVRLNHISGMRAGSTEDDHLPLDHPDSVLPWAEIRKRIFDVPTSIEYKGNEPERVTAQVRFLYDRVGDQG